MVRENRRQKNVLYVALLGLMVVLLYLVGSVSFPLFHALTSFFNVIIGFSIFIIALNTKDVAENSFFMFLGIAYGFVAVFDLLYALAFHGVDFIGVYGDNLVAQMWILARYTESVSILAAVLLFSQRKVNIYAAVGTYATAAVFLLAAIFYVPLFPACYIEGQGFTGFKLVSEYLVVGILAVALLLIARVKRIFHQQVFRYLLLSVVASIMAEMLVSLSFIRLELVVFGAHLFKLASFYFIYKALVVTSLSEPQKVLFYELAEVRNKTLKYNEQLTKEIKNHKQTARMLQRVNRALNVLSESNRVIIEAKDESELISNICRVIVEVGGYHSAWVGYAEQNRDRMVRSLPGDGEAQAGTMMASYVKPGANQKALSVRGGTDQPARPGRPGFDYNAWRLDPGRATKSEFAVPLLLDSGVTGSLNITAAEPDAFSEVEAELLTKLSQNLAYGLSMIRSRAEKKIAEDALRESEEKFRLLFHNANDAIFLVTVDESPPRFLEVNDVSCKKFGFSRNELLNKNIEEVFFDQELKAFKNFYEECLEMGHTTHELVIVSRDGKRVPVEANCHLFNLKDRLVMLSIARDITERKEAEEQLKFISLHDALTGLYNRAYYEREMNRLDNRRHYPAGIIICDVDGLKLINDTLGHDAGDTLLVNVAKIIKQCFRDGDTVARIGGDEFSVLLSDLDAHAVEVACKRIRDAIDNYNDSNPEMPLSISIGSAVSSSGYVSMKELFKEADNQMYREKLHRRQSARSSIVHTLIKALEERDFITGGHAERLQDLVVALANRVGLEERQSDLRLLAQFHDIGKVGIPDRILFKEGPLTAEETKEMQRHCEIGYRIAQSAPELAPIANWILRHHEWWDGSGYPMGLKGEDIPLECRILAIADAYDAMTSDRPYRRALDPREAYKELRLGAGAQFDPELVEIFIALMEAGAEEKSNAVSL